MGQQQLLLIIVGTVIVGIAIAVAISLFNSQASATNRDEVTNDLAQLATVAQAYYRKPRILAGGGRSFGGLRLRDLTSSPNNPRNLNGNYSLVPDPVGGNPPFVTLMGEGTEVGNNGVDRVKVVMYVFPDSISVDMSLGN